MTITEDIVELKDIVSNAKVLDFFLAEDEQPSVILNHVLLNIDEAHELLTRSTQWTKIFSYDFLHRCNQRDAELLIDIANILLSKFNKKNFGFFNYASLPYFIRNILVHCSWQVLNASSDLSVYLKTSFKKINNDILFNSDYGSHISAFYSSNNYKTINEVDASIIKAINEGFNVEYVISKLNQKSFEYLIKHIDKSIFFFRILQYDVFAQLSYQYKYILVNDIFPYIPPFSSYEIAKYNLKYAEIKISEFIQQILDQDEDDNIKIALFNLLESQECMLIFRENKKCKYTDFTEMLFETTINGDVLNEDKMKNIILYCIVHRNINFLKEWIEYDKKWFDSIISMSTAVELYIQNYICKGLQHEDKRKISN